MKLDLKTGVILAFGGLAVVMAGLAFHQMVIAPAIAAKAAKKVAK